MSVLALVLRDEDSTEAVFMQYCLHNVPAKSSQ